jgi:hypothetical protein
MKKSKAMINGMLVAAPWMTTAALVILSILLPNRASVGARALERKAEIAKAIDDVPFIIGRWYGEVPEQGRIPREAQKLLKPNAMLNRVYSTSGATVHVVLVHCGDARDMIGHYPPICYPSAGWMPMPDEPNHDHVLNVSGVAFPVREYGFKGYLHGGREDTIRIFNAFILPDGVVTREIDDVNRQSERLSVAVEGVAQLQIITQARLPVEEAMSAAEEILSGMTELFGALQVGQTAASKEQAHGSRQTQ